MAVTIKRGRTEAYNFLKKHNVGVLATVTADHEPHATAIYYLIDSSFTISFITKTNTKKADNLQHNNHAVLLVYEAESQTTVQTTGVVSEVKDMLKINELFTQVIYASIETGKTSVPPIAKLEEGDYVAYQLKPKQVHMAVFSHSASGSYEHLFKTFVPEK
jgi:general stress protein 26